MKKKKKKHKSHLYNKKKKKMPGFQDIQFFFSLSLNKERSRHAECTIKQ